jgi:peptidoglycan/LPS O-acetylase OafA/YrhL
VKKLGYLESLRGLAAFIVVLNHFVLAFYPALYFGASEPVHTENGVEVFLSGTPLNLLYNGSFAVSLFFILSGFVLTYKFFKDRTLPVYLIPLTVKRYVRLLPPVFISILLSFILLRFSLLSNQPAAIITRSGWLRGYLQFGPNLLTALYESFIGSFFRHQSTYNGVLWTMTFEFFGSLLVFLFVALFRNEKRRYLVYVLALALLRHRPYGAFILGVLLCDFITLRPDLFAQKRYTAFYFILLGAGLFLGSYPVGRPVEGTMYAFMKLPVIARSYNVLGAGLVLFALLNLPSLQDVLSRGVFVFLGKISFSLYILHFLLISSLGCAVFCFVAPHLSYHAAFLVMFLATMPVILIASFLTYLFIDQKGVGLSQTVYEYAITVAKRYGRVPIRFVPLPLRSNPLYRSLFQYEAELRASPEE